MIKYILAWRFVKSIFKEAKAYEWYNGKAFFSVNEDVLKTLFPKEYAEAKSKAERIYLEESKKRKNRANTGKQNQI